MIFVNSSLSKSMNTCFLLIGGNMGDRVYYLSQAIHLIKINIGRIIHLSIIYETEAWGLENQPSFLNQVLMINTYLSAEEVLIRSLHIEKQLDRVRTEKYAARTIDIDLLLFNNDIYQTAELTIPHPRMAERRFVLEPLKSIAPTYLHPVYLKTIEQLWEECKDPLEVKKFVL